MNADLSPRNSWHTKALNRLIKHEDLHITLRGQAPS